MNKVSFVEQEFLRTDIPDFRPGDTVKVHVRVVEGQRERVQVFQGVVIRKQNGGLRETFTVRKISFGVGVERTFPIHSPTIAKVEVVSRGRVRRAKLYYLRELRGKKARIRERRDDDLGAAVVEAVDEPDIDETAEERSEDVEALDEAAENEASAEDDLGTDDLEGSAETPAADDTAEADVEAAAEDDDAS